MHMQLAIWEEESNASVEQSEMSLWPVAGQMLVHNTVALPLAAVNISKGNSEMKHQKNPRLIITKDMLQNILILIRNRCPKLPKGQYKWLLAVDGV